MDRPTVITLPPPTPNGGLHLGHISGPLIAADAFRRQLDLSGQVARSVTYSDANQSYVRTTAERQGRDAYELARAWTADMHETLAIYDIIVDDFRFPDEASGRFVRDHFVRLFDQGSLIRKPFPFFYSARRSGVMDEAGVSGFCPTCLAKCKCGICEACGSLNTAATLLAPEDTITGDSDLNIVYADVLALDVEVHRDGLKRFYAGSFAARSRYKWLVEDALSCPLAPFPVTIPGKWGISIDHAEFPGQVINPWAEVMAQLLFSYSLGSPTPPPLIVNFFGFDNSYFYALVHAALLIASDADEWLPRAVLINEFYNLDHGKFSTSSGHVIWARDLALRYSPDVIRFYAAFNSPGLEKANFNEAEMEQVIRGRLLRPWEAVRRHFDRIPDNNRAASAVSDAALSIGRTSLKRVLRSVELERFHLRQATEDVLYLLEFILHSLERDGMSVNDHAFLLKCLAQAFYPIMPMFGKALYRSVAGRALSTVDWSPEVRIGRLPEIRLTPVTARHEAALA